MIDDDDALLRYGVSAELIGLMASITESRRADGEDRYDTRTVRNFEQYIVARKINSRLWSLAHLITAIEATKDAGVMDSATEKFFWIDEAITATRFQHAFSQPVETQPIETQPAKTMIRCAWEGGGLTIAYASGRSHQIPESQINLLAAFLEFALFAWDGLREAIASVAAAPSEAAADQLSRQLQSAVNGYLGEHMQRLTQQRKGHFITQWVRNDIDRANAEINDLILRLWGAHAATDGLDLKKYNTVVECFHSLLVRQSKGREAAELSAPRQLGSFEEGGVDLERLAQAADDFDFDGTDDSNVEFLGPVDDGAQVNALAAYLDENEPVMPMTSSLRDDRLADVNLVFNKYQPKLKLIEKLVPFHRQLALSVLRMACFGAHQEDIGQSQRFRADDKAGLTCLVRCEGVTPYSEYLEDLGAISELLEKLQACLIHILIGLEHPDGLTRLLHRVSSETRCHIGKIMGEPGNAASELFARLPQLAIANRDLNVELRRAKSAFAATRRAGLTNMPTVDRAADYAFAADVIDSLQKTLTDFREALEGAVNNRGGAARLFASDLKTFAATFEELYGEQI